MGSPCGALSVWLGLRRGPLQVPAWELPAAEAREALPAGPRLCSQDSSLFLPLPLWGAS